MSATEDRVDAALTERCPVCHRRYIDHGDECEEEPGAATPSA